MCMQLPAGRRQRPAAAAAAAACRVSCRRLHRPLLAQLPPIPQLPGGISKHGIHCSIACKGLAAAEEPTQMRHARWAQSVGGGMGAGPAQALLHGPPPLFAASVSFQTVWCGYLSFQALLSNAAIATWCSGAQGSCCAFPRFQVSIHTGGTLRIGAVGQRRPLTRPSEP